MNTAPQAQDFQDSAFQALMKASEQYEVYVRLAEVGAPAADRREEARPSYADWSHPIGLAVSTVR